MTDMRNNIDTNPQESPRTQLFKFSDSFVPTNTASSAASNLSSSYPGLFITFEGGEGAGKTTHSRFLAQALREEGYEVVCLREPGGTRISEDLRAVVLNPEHESFDDRAELLVYEAARAQLTAEVIEPALMRGAVVLCDRFTDSTLAYQVYGRGLPRTFVEQANAFACKGIKPHRTLVFVAGEEASEGLARATQHAADRLELAGVDFHARVNSAFLELAHEEPERIRVLSSQGSKPRTAQMLFEHLADLFPWMSQKDERYFTTYFAEGDAS